jgi:hypothetical protein
VRALLEVFREGYNWTFFGIPVAILVSGGGIAFGVVSIWWRHRLPPEQPPPEEGSLPAKPPTEDGLLPARELPG